MRQIRTLMKLKKILIGKPAVRLYILCGCVILLLLTTRIPAVSEYVFARGISRGINFILSRITGIFPFSFYDLTVGFLIAAAVCILVFGIIFLFRKQYQKILKYLYKLAFGILCAVIFFTVSYGALYARYGIETAVGLQKGNVTEETLQKAGDAYLSLLLSSEKNLSRNEASDIVVPYSFSELVQKINGEYQKQDGGYFNRYSIAVKSPKLSDMMSYLRITGIYFPFSAEANVNTNCASYETAFIAAHEIAHAKGVADETQANLMAFYICLNAGDAYLNYSAAMTALLRLTNDLYSLNRTLYSKLYSTFPDRIKREFQNDTQAYHRYDSFIGDLSQFFNHLYLKLNGISTGIRSYSLTTAYLVNMITINSDEPD